MRAELVDQPDAALAVAKADQIFAHQLGLAPAGSPAREFRSPAGTAPSSAAAACPSACRGRRGSTGRSVHATSWRRFLGTFVMLAAAIIGGSAVQGSRTPCRCRASPLQRETRPGSARKSRSRPRSMRACGRRAGLCWSAIRRRSRCMPAPPGSAPQLNVIADAAEADWANGAVNLLDAREGSNAPVEFGKVDAAYGRASLASARRAIKAALAGAVEAVVAAPQTERSIAAAGIAFRRLSVVRRARDRHAGRGRLSDDLLRRSRASCTRPCMSACARRSR